jgi:hypothetical protein
VGKIENDITLKQRVVETLLYFNIFNYPLKSSEVFNFLHTNGIIEQDVKRTLDSLTEENIIHRSNEFYSIQSDESIFLKRIQGNIEAKKNLPIALKRANFIGKFPFVRSVMASGSLSKEYMDEHSDLDFFIVTAPGRLWISRMLLVTYKRVFLRNSHKHFCVNYFIDSDHLEIEEKNLFTATELATVLPLYGCQYYPILLEKNERWLKEQFPNFKPRVISKSNEQKNVFKTVIETLFNIFGGSLLDKIFMNITQRRWKKMYSPNYKDEDFRVAFKSRKYASKNHPRNFQKKVMESYHMQLISFRSKFDFMAQ